LPPFCTGSTEGVERTLVGLNTMMKNTAAGYKDRVMGLINPRFLQKHQDAAILTYYLS